MLFALLSPAFASVCAAPTVRSYDLAPDGSTWLLSADAESICWWIVDDNGDDRVAAHWSAVGTRRPVAIEALADGRALLVVEDATGWQLMVRGVSGDQDLLPIRLSAPPDRIVAHPLLPLAAIRSPEAAGDVRVVLVDLDLGRVVATVTVTAAHADMRFVRGDDRLYLGGLVLGPDGIADVSDAPGSRS